MLAAESPGVADGLLLLSYPLHPPRRPRELRVAHFPALRTPAMFVHGSRDPFGTVGELRQALRSIPARTSLVVLDGAGHDWRPRGPSATADGVAGTIVDEFLGWLATAASA